MKHILLVRHTESLKNVLQTFSTDHSEEPLTATGKHQADELAKGLRLFAKQNGLRCHNVYCAESVRAKETAKPICMALRADLRTYLSLRSIHSSFEGKPESVVLEQEPEFMHSYILYRKGVMNAYDLKRPRGYENLGPFEFRINQTIQQILEIPDEDLKILVLHRSPITASLIYFARQANKYPEDYYGHIQLDIGYVSWITIHSQGMYDIRYINVPIMETIKHETSGDYQAHGSNPFIRSRAMSTPVEHRAKEISSINTKSDIMVKHLVEAFQAESDMGLRKLIVLKLKELLDVKNVIQLAEQLNQMKLNLAQTEQYQQALQWQVKY